LKKWQARAVTSGPGYESALRFIGVVALRPADAARCLNLYRKSLRIVIPTEILISESAS
jgi:hypothetical protein